MSADDFDPDLTLHDVARIMRKSYDTVARLARAGRIGGAYQLGGPGSDWRVMRHEFEEWRLAQLRPRQATDKYGLEPPSPLSAARRRNKKTA